MVCPVFQVYFTRHSHVTGPETQSNCIISGMCGPPAFYFLFFRKWGQKVWSARFWWVINKLAKPGGPLTIFMPYLADLLPFMVMFKRMLWLQSGPPAYHHHGKSIVFVEFVNVYLNLTTKPRFPYLWLLYFSHSTLKIMIIFYR